MSPQQDILYDYHHIPFPRLYRKIKHYFKNSEQYGHQFMITVYAMGKSPHPYFTDTEIKSSVMTV